jgi:glucose dehydrogenase
MQEITCLWKLRTCERERQDCTGNDGCERARGADRLAWVGGVGADADRTGGGGVSWRHLPSRPVTAERLANPEPGNWLMNHRTYDAQRYSPLDKINKGNVKSLKLAHAVAIGGTSIDENLQSNPLAEDG